MAAENAPKASEDAVAVASTATSTKQRKKRKWDEPAESLITSAGLVLPDSFPMVTSSIAGLNSPAASVLPGSIPAACATASQPLKGHVIPHSTAAIIQKLNTPKIEDEVIAREIVINDADSTIRYKLTKRQTQEEIQKVTGAIVITRGKFRPPNGLPDGEKPLYLHISAGAHLKDTAERIKAVDLAASMVEEILKYGHTFQPGHSFPPTSTGTQVCQPLNACVYLGFDPDPSLNISARIRGPNDQYISHIMNVTGANVVLRGRGVVHPESSTAVETNQPIHLFISCTNARSLEEAKILAENLLDTISAECNASRMTTPKVYGAVPPPQQLLVGDQSSTTDATVVKPVATSTNHDHTSSSVTPSVSLFTPTYASASMPITSSSYNSSSIAKGTSYLGYGGIYPQATPLQQVAQALRNAPSSASMSTITASVASTASSTNASSQSYSGTTVETERRSQRRKFQELPAMACGPSADLQNTQQESVLKPKSSCGERDISSSQLPDRNLVQPVANGIPQSSRSVSPTPLQHMLPPPPRMMPPPPPPPRMMPPPPPPPRMMPPQPRQEFPVPKLPPKSQSQDAPQKQKAPVSDTLLKLMEYGDEDDDTPEGLTDQGLSSGMPVDGAAAKPFWAV